MIPFRMVALWNIAVPVEPLGNPPIHILRDQEQNDGEEFKGLAERREADDMDT